MQIDHDPHEFTARKTASIWWAAFGILALIWAWYLYFHAAHWTSFGMGFVTAAIFFSWAYDVTGGKVPESWRSKPPRT